MRDVNNHTGRGSPSLCRGSAAVLLVAWTHAVQAQTPPADQVLERATSYVVNFVERFSTVVAEERYVQELNSLPQVNGTGSNKQFSQVTPKRRTRRSDFLLVRRKTDAQWNTLRDVFEVDGRAVRDRGERLSQLLARPGAEGDEEARRIALEGARYSLAGPSRTIDNPLTVLALLQPATKTRFAFAMAKRDAAFPPTVAVLAYREVARPTILRNGRADRLTTGRVWIESDTGRVLQTELVVSGGDHVVTQFRWDDRFQIALPVEMSDSFAVGTTAIEGRATYGEFRRFGVTTQERLETVQR